MTSEVEIVSCILLQKKLAQCIRSYIINIFLVCIDQVTYKKKSIE